MTARETIDRALALCDTAGVQPHALRVSATDAILALGACADYRAVLAAAKAKHTGGRLLPHPTRRLFDAIDPHPAGLVLIHDCWPHLDCWGAAE